MSKWLLGLIVIVVIAAGGSYASLSMIDSRVDEALIAAQSDLPTGLSVEVVEDTNQLLQRELLLKVTYAEASIQELTALVSSTVHKRPWKAELDYEVTLDEASFGDADDKTVEWARDNLVEQPMLFGTVEVSPTGSFNAVVESFSVSESTIESGTELSITSEPVYVEVQGDMNGTVAMSGSWPGMEFKFEDTETVAVSVAPVTLAMDGYYVHDAVFIGTQMLKSEGMNFESNSPNEQVTVLLGASSLNSSSELVDGQFAGEFSLRTDQFLSEVAGTATTVSNLMLALNISGIDPENLSSLSTLSQQFSPEAPLPEELTEIASAILQDGFSIELPNWHAEIEGHDFDINSSVSLPANDVADVSNVFTLMNLLPEVSASFDFAFDSAAMEDPTLADALFALMMTGMLVEDSDRYRLSAAMDGGAATVNGEPAPFLPF